MTEAAGGGAVRAGGAAARRDPHDRDAADAPAEDGERRARRPRRVRPEGRARRRGRSRSSRCVGGRVVERIELVDRRRSRHADRDARRRASTSVLQAARAAVLRGSRRRRPRFTCRSRSARPTRAARGAGSRRRAEPPRAGSSCRSAARSAACSTSPPATPSSPTSRASTRTPPPTTTRSKRCASCWRCRRPAPDRVLRHLDDSGQRDRRVDGRVRGRPDEAGGVPEVQDPGLGARGSGLGSLGLLGDSSARRRRLERDVARQRLRPPERRVLEPRSRRAPSH